VLTCPRLSRESGKAARSHFTQKAIDTIAVRRIQVPSVFPYFSDLAGSSSSQRSTVLLGAAPII
jgi:hypothetical protein